MLVGCQFKHVNYDVVANLGDNEGLLFLMDVSRQFPFAVALAILIEFATVYYLIIFAVIISFATLSIG